MRGASKENQCDDTQPGVVDEAASILENLLASHNAERRRRVLSRSNRERFTKNFLTQDEPLRLQGSFSDVSAVAASLAEATARAAKRNEEARQWKKAADERARTPGFSASRSIPSSPTPASLAAKRKDVRDRKPMLYVWTTPEEKREQLFAYHLAKKILEQRQEESERKAAMRQSTRSHSSTLRANSISSTLPANMPATADKTPDMTASDGSLARKVFQLLGEDSNKTLYDMLETFVADYEVRHGRQPRTDEDTGKMPRSCSSLVTPSSSLNTKAAVGSPKVKTKGTGTVVDCLESEDTFSNSCGTPSPCVQGLKPIDGSLSRQVSQGVCSSVDDKLSKGVAEKAGSYVPSSGREPDDAEAAIDRLTKEREERAEFIAKHVEYTLKCLSNPEGCSRCAAAHGKRSKSSDTSPPETHRPFVELVGLNGLTRQQRALTAPQDDLIRLASVLASDRGLQKCTEAAARLVTYVLMCALPAELFRGDPEDFIALRQHAQRLASGDSTKPSARCMDCGSPKLPSSCFHGSPSGSRSLAQSPTQRDGERCNSSASRGADCSPLLRNGSQKDEKYLLHTDLSSAQQAFQSVAIRHGYWLSYSEHMLRRPPFHACGLPLRAARDIAVWQRPPDMGLLSNETVPHGSGEGRFTDFEGSFNATTLSKASKVSSVLDAEAHLFDGSIYSDAVSLLRKDLTRDKGGRPRMLAPLLVYAHGGYGTAPFSVCDAADSMPVGEQDVDNDDFQYDDRCQFSFGGNSEGNAEVDMRDVYLSMPDEFLHPEPSLLPLHYIMQSIYSSVRENRTIQIDKSTRAALPVVVDLLVDAVKSYEGFLQSFIDASFESSSLASFFFRTYQDIVLDWVPFVICETAIEYAIGRVAACPTGNTWVFAVRHGGFTEAELEEIAFSGLIQRTFPSLTHWTYDEELLRKTVDTVRDVVLSTIVRVKGELYFLFTGVDNRKLFFERYQEMLKREREELLAVQAKVEEEMNARIPGYSKSGRCTPFQQGKTKSMEFSVGSRRPASGLKRQSSVALKALGNISHAKRVATGETPGQQNGAVSGPLEQSQCGVTVLLSTVEDQSDNALRLSAFRPDTADNEACGAQQSQQQLSDEAIDSHWLPSLESCTATCTLSEVPLKDSSVQGMPAPNVLDSATTLRFDMAVPQGHESTEKDLFHSAVTFCSTRPDTQHGCALNGIPEDLSLRNVRRELVGLHIHRNSERTGKKSGGGASAGGSRMQQSITSTLHSVSTGQSLGTTGPPEMPSHITDSMSATVGRARTAGAVARVPPLVAVVGSKRAKAVKQIRKSFERTVQFHVHFQEAANNEVRDDSRTLQQSQWYVIGNHEYYERCAVARIRRSRQVAAFDLHHLSPITTLGLCVERSHRGAQCGEDEVNSAQVDNSELQPKDLRLGRNIVPWTL